MGLALFLDQVTETIRHPGLGSILLLVVIAAGIVLIAWALGRWLSNEPDGYAEHKADGLTCS